jgi:hypothetical protein
MADHPVQRKRQNEHAIESEDEMTPSGPQPPRNKKRKSNSQPQTSTNKKRKASAEENSAAGPSNPAKKKKKKSFTHLRPQTRRIPQETIQTTWKRLPEPAQRQVRSLFLGAKRTSLHSIRDPRRRTEAEAAVSAMVRKLEKQLPRMPFPPGVKGGSFGLDEVVGRSVSFPLCTVSKWARDGTNYCCGRELSRRKRSRQFILSSCCGLRLRKRSGD